MNLIFAASGLCFLILNLSADASETRFKLAFEKPDIRVGQVLEITAQKTEIASRTNTIRGHVDTTNGYYLLDFKGRLKILSWDEFRKTSLTEITIEHLLLGERGVTNDLLEPGSVVLCNFVAGDAFYKLSDGVLTAKANRALEQLGAFYPGSTNADLENKAMRLTEPHKVGELWEGDPVPVAYDLEKALGERLDPKTIRVNVQFNQVTNRFGLDCFDLEERIRASTPFPGFKQLFRVYRLAKNLRIEVDSTQRYIRPFGRGLPLFRSASLIGRVSAEADEGRATIRLYFSWTDSCEIRLLSTSGEGGESAEGGR
jgi:hypothetical protein